MTRSLVSTTLCSSTPSSSDLDTIIICMLFWEYHNLIPADIAKFLAITRPNEYPDITRRDVLAVFDFLARHRHGTYLRWKEVFDSRREADIIVVKEVIARVESSLGGEQASKCQ